jgi:hypothetical protein
VIDLRSRLDTPPAVVPSVDGHDLVTDFVTKDILDLQLADIAAHGIRIASLHDSQATLWDALADYKSSNIAGPYVYEGSGDPEAVEADRKAHSASDFYYQLDTLTASTTAAIMADRAKSGLQTAAYIAHQKDFDALQDNLDVPIYYRDEAYPQQLLQTHGERTSSKRDWWYWFAGNGDAHANRYSAGYLLWRANLYGAFVPVYQLAFGTDPYDETSSGADPAHALFRPEMLTYPAKDGILDTVQWEAVREGITDVRYLTTYYSAMRECKDKHIQKALVAESEAYVKDFIDKALVILPDSEYDNARSKIAHYAVKLRKAVDAYDKAHPEGT